jgi:predicted DNA-binding transcriptional regulator AlpA
MTLLTPQDIAQMLQVHQKTALQVIRSPGFPPPAVDHSRKVRLWIKDSVEKWLREQEKRNG